MKPQVSPYLVSLRVGQALAGADLLPRLVALRDQLAHELAVPWPEPLVIADHQLPPRSYVIQGGHHAQEGQVSPEDPQGDLVLDDVERFWLAHAGDILDPMTTARLFPGAAPETHAGLVRRALEAGKDVLVEKPLCLDIDEGRALVALAERNHRVLMVGHLLQYHPAVLRLCEMVRGGELGRIQYIYSNRLNLGRIRREENIRWSFAPHDVSVILGLLGELPENVQAQGGNYLHEKIADVTVSLLSFPSGVKAHIFVSWLHPFKEQKLVVVGDRKMAVFDDMEPERKVTVYDKGPEQRADTWGEWQTRSGDISIPKVPNTEPLRLECEHFLALLRGEGDRVAAAREPT